MAGNPASAPQVPPTGTPPAQPPAQGGNVPPATPPTQSGKMHSQEEVDQIVKDKLKADRENLEKELGLSGLGLQIKDVKAILKAKKDADLAAKTKEELLQQERDEAKAEVTRMKLEGFKRTTLDGMIAAKKIKLPEGVSISDVLDMVSGQDEDGIKASAEKLTKFFPFNASMGSGSNPANQGQKEATLDEQIKAANMTGLKTGDWTLYNRLTLQKQQKG
jgi:DNA-binding transcriptional MerR regulator